MTLDELRAAMNRVRRVNAGEDRIEVYGTSNVVFGLTVATEHMEAEKCRIADALLDPTLIDEPWLREMGFKWDGVVTDRYEKPINDETWVYVDPFRDAEIGTSSVDNGSVPLICGSPLTRGQLLSLLAALGAGDKQENDNE